MNPELVMAGLLAHPTIAVLVGDRIALEELPEGTITPAIVYKTVTGVPLPNLDPKDQPKARARFQINPIAPTLAQVKEVHACVRAALDFADNRSIAGKLVVSCRMAGIGPVSKDDTTGNWTQPVDYLLMYNE